MKSTTAFLFALLILITTVHSQSSKQWLDVNYAGDTLTGHRMDIYLPQGGKVPYPVIVTIAGSAWFGNNTKKQAYQKMGIPILKNGYAVVAINHRFSRQAIFPAQINDVKAAIRFIRANAATYQLDTTFIGITGDSSGGHLSAMMGTTRGLDQYTVGAKSLSLEGKVGKFLNQSSRIDAVVDWYGPSTFQAMDSCGSSFSHDAPDSPESTLTGGPIQQNDNMCALANPITYIDRNDPPFLLLHGDGDKIVPHCQSLLLDKALQAKGVQSRLIIVPKAGHGEGMWLDQYTAEMVKFFDAQKAKKKKGDVRIKG
ncbi:alpha/beta hydrolase [Rhodocytophaga rosea]|uniref:Alpha/beta hydrolase n=1 Tax=Rhodocytophaga rosea TaxID=2704465 RepID=A0A6C0GCA4_9BACT|nr:alpha/beta hydrolase [Rhodocytophaga rosea]QHT65484.1 alpha/beta hydrolase [Rhodocytophaga rosea]